MMHISIITRKFDFLFANTFGRKNSELSLQQFLSQRSG